MRITVAFVCLFLSIVGAYSQAGLPPQIQEYYRDVNAISMISTPAERLSIALNRPDAVNTLDPARTRALSQALAFVLGHEIQQTIDPRMVSPSGTDSFMWAFSFAINVIGQVDQTSSGFVLQIRKLYLSEQDRERLIGQYVRLGVVPDADLGKITGGTWAAGIEIHEWIMVDGKWMKKPLLQVLVP